MDNIPSYVHLMTERAYSEKDGVMYYCSPLTLTREEAFKVMKAIVPVCYNDFTPAQLKALPKDCRVRVAREYSACVYVETKKPFKPSKRIRVSEFNLAQEHEGTFTYRLWWD